MATWNYRIIDHGDHYALHEVHYDDDGVAKLWTDEPISFVCDDCEEPTSITNSLAMAAYSAAANSVLRAVDGKLVPASLVHRGDMTPMMLEKAVENYTTKPFRDIALSVRKRMMASLPDDVIGSITESHIVFATACLFEQANRQNTDA